MAAAALGGLVGPVPVTISMGREVGRQEGVTRIRSRVLVESKGGWRADNVSSSSVQWRKQWREVGGAILPELWLDLGEERLGK